ncbi:site-2 protease family protein [Streptomyces olivaceus]|uniref:site-2 protease family protein n=1 Tax=Streptomyces olivaceus TaxID=47716 RepID=UPI0018A81DEF|nr:site-2 protease family protein [Streptomyces olivaceus]MBF8172511.1 site-2 protease family protein [Streptomyces olivaceus]
MDVSGGSGQPRSGNDESAEPQAGPETAPVHDSTPPDPATPSTPAPEPADRRPRPAEATVPRDPDPSNPEPQAPETPGQAAPRHNAPRHEAPASEAQLPGTPGAGTPGADAPAVPPSDEPSAQAAPARSEHGERAPHGTAPDAPTPAGPPPPGPETPGGNGGGTDPWSKPPAPDEHPAHRPEEHSSEEHSSEEHRPEEHRPAEHRRPAHHAAGPRHRTEAHTGGDGSPGRPPQRRPEPGGGLLMGRPFGVPVYVAPSWFLVAALITWVFGGQLDRVLPELGAARYLVSLFFAVAFYASVLVHELAHTVAALRFKLPVRRIQLQFFGGVSEIEKEAETPGREFVLAFVGPLLSLVLAGVFYAALLPVEPDSVPGVLLAGLMVSNLIVAVFNLLPGLPLDGGRMLRAVVWKITGKPMSGTVAAAWVGRALAIAVLVGLPLLTQSLGSGAADDVGMDTVMDALLAAILAAIIWTGAGNSLRMARLREHLPELRARALTRRAVPVPADTPLSEALRRANASGARALVVVDTEGRPVSLVREAAIVGVPEHRRPWVPVSTLAQDLTDGMRVSAELSGEELLDALRANPATEYLVVEDTGEIYGVLSAADVERAFVKAMARPS